MFSKLQDNEKTSNFFDNAVESEYLLEFPDVERENYDNLKNRIKEKNGITVDKEMGSKLSTPELKLLWITLRTVMVRNIANLAKLQKDRPGNWRLWQQKLITERYWNSMCECEEEVKKDVEDAQKESEFLRPGHGDDFFNESLAVWRDEVKLEVLKEQKARLEELQKQELAKAKQEETKIQEQSEAAQRKAEKDKEKMLEQLLLEDEREMEKEKKKGGKKANTTRNRKAKK